MPAERPQRAEHTEREIEAVAEALDHLDSLPLVGYSARQIAETVLEALDRVRDARNDDVRNSRGYWRPKEENDGGRH